MAQKRRMPRLTRFALFELDGPDGKLVCLRLESSSKPGDVRYIEVAMEPTDAVENGNALVEIGTALRSARH